MLIIIIKKTTCTYKYIEYSYSFPSEYFGFRALSALTSQTSLVQSSVKDLFIEVYNLKW